MWRIHRVTVSSAEINPSRASQRVPFAAESGLWEEKDAALRAHFPSTLTSLVQHREILKTVSSGKIIAGLHLFLIKSNLFSVFYINLDLKAQLCLYELGFCRGAQADSSPKMPILTAKCRTTQALCFAHCQHGAWEELASLSRRKYCLNTALSLPWPKNLNALHSEQNAIESQKSSKVQSGWGPTACVNR